MCAFRPSPPAAASDCCLYCKTTDDNAELPGLMVGYWGSSTNFVVARKFTLTEEADIRQIGFYCKRISYQGYPDDKMSIYICPCEDGKPPSTVFRGGDTDSSWIGTEPGWYYCPNVTAHDMPAGTYWLVMQVDPSSYFQVRWIGSKTNQCGAADDNLIGKFDPATCTWKDWQPVHYECAYELVCADCPQLVDPSCTSSEPVIDNGWRYYDYEVTYINGGGVLPSVHRVKFDSSPCDEWCEMERIDSNSPVEGTRYRKRFGGRLGVGTPQEHKFTLQFDTPGARSIVMTCNGLNIPGLKPVVDSATFNPCALRTDQQIFFSSSARDDDSADNITNYHWVFTDVDNPARTVAFDTTEQAFSKYGSDIGVGVWNVALTVTDDDFIDSDAYSLHCANDTSVTRIQIVSPAAPIIDSVKASVDGMGTDTDGSVGVFITGVGVDIWNTFTATVSVPPNGNGVSRVDFTLEGIGTVSDADGPPYQASFNMGALPEGVNFLEVRAYNNSNPPDGSEIKYVLVHILGPPSWWNSWWAYDKSVSYDSALKEYTFRCKVPQIVNPWPPPQYISIDYEYDIDAAGLFELENHFISRIDIIEHFRVDGYNNNKEYWTYWGEGLLDATLLSQELYRQTFPLDYQPMQGALNPEYARNLLFYKVPIFSPNKYEKSIEGPSYDYRGVIMAGPIPVEYHAGLSTEIGFGAQFTIDGRLNSALGLESMVYTPTIDFTVTFDAFIEIYEGLAKLGFKAEPNFCCDMPLILHMPDQQHPNMYFQFEPCAQFKVDCTVYGSVGWGVWEGDLYTTTYPDPPWKYGWPNPNCIPVNCGAESSARAQAANNFLFNSPTIASDKEGASTVCVWLHDTDPTDKVDPELYYSYRPTVAGGWSVPAPVFAANNQKYETDPKVIYTDQNKIMLVWTQNELAKNADWTSIPNTIKEQELYYTTATYNAGAKTIQWSGLGARKLTDDTNPAKNPQFPNHHGDGLVSLGADQNHGNAVAVWVRENYTPVPGVQRDDTNYNPTWDVYAATYNGAAQTWSNPFLISPAADNTADAQPDVAMSTSGDIMVAWARDADGDFTTNNDRFVATRTYSAQNAAWGPMVLQNTWPSGALSPAVTYDSAGSAIVLFNTRDVNSKDQPIQDGPDERLWSACFSANPPVIAPVSNTAEGPRCLESKIRCDLMNQTVAVWRGFPAAGQYGYNGQIAMNLRYAGMLTCANWGGTAFLTNDNSTKWQVDFDIDQSDMIRIVYVKKDGALPGAQFGQGYDGIYLMEIGRGPDLVIDSVTLDKERPLPGELVTMTATIRNAGNQRAFGFNVDFMLDTGLIGSQNVSMLTGQGSVDLQQTWYSDGRPHVLTVLADATNTVAETNESNNAFVADIGRIPPPNNLTAYGDSVSGGIELTWDHPGADHFNIYRGDAPGVHALIDTTPFAHYLDLELQLNHDYYYVVTAADSTQESDPSNEVMANIGLDHDEDAIPDVSDPDDDNDGMDDACEIANGFDQYDPADGPEDFDDDDFTNAEECQAGTDPKDPDSHPDTLPPTTPVVTAPRYTTGTSQLTATWTATDSYSGIAEYRYAIGTSAGSTDTRTWTSNGASSSLTATGLSLANGTTYYIAVVAIDAAGNQSAMGASSGTTVDATAPVITGPSAQPWTPQTSVSASWDADDSESYVSKFEYSVGSSVGAADIVGWTDVGLALGVLRTGMSLANGQVCYVNVRATNGAGLTSTASSGAIRAVEVPGTIAAALGLSDEMWVALTGKTVTGVVSPYAWIEEPDRTAAIRLLTGAALEVGQNVTVVGQLQTPVYARQISPETITVESAGNPARSLAMRNTWVGGSARNELTRGVEGAVGLNNVCLLITTWGEVTAVGDGYFYIDDGSGLLDGTGNIGIRVNSQGLTNPSVHSFAVVTGLVNASKLLPDTTSIRLLIPRRQSDIRVIGGPTLPDNPANANGVDTVGE